MKILHVCESLIGGPASYFEEILPFQVQADLLAKRYPART